MPGIAIAGNNVSIDNTIYAQAYGAKGDLIYTGDGTHLQDGACNNTGTTFTSASGGFTRALIGDVIIIDGAGAGSGEYFGIVTGFTNSTTLTISFGCQTTVSAADWRIGYDNASVLQNAINAVPNGYGTVFIPAGKYLMRSGLTLPPTECNVTIAGDPSGTVLMPWFSSGSAVAFVDTSTSPPLQCFGGVRDINFENWGNSPTNLNLIRVSNEQNIRISHILGSHFGGSGDSTIYIDPGASSAGSTFTELTDITDLSSYYDTNMITFDGENYSGFSVNNTTLTNSNCNPTNGGACINLINWATNNSGLLDSHFEFNDDLNASGENVVATTHRADDFNGVETLNIRSQSLTTGTALFSAPANTGLWYITGSVVSNGPVGGVSQERNSNPVLFNSIYKGEQNTYNSTVSLSNCGTSPTLFTGSTASAGEIEGGSGASGTCQLTFFNPLGTNNSDCHITSDGHNEFFFSVASKTSSGVTFACYDVLAAGPCNLAGAFFSYGCTGF